MIEDWQIGSFAYWHRRCSSIEGKALCIEGSFLITLCRAFFGWGRIHDAAWPDATMWSGPEPEGLDEIAKAQRISTYLRVDTLEDAQRCLASWPTFGLQAALPVTHDWFYADGGHVELPPEGAPVIGTHVVDVVEFLPSEQRIRFWNPWRNWGNQGYGTMSAELFKAGLREAWSICSARPKLPSVRGCPWLNNGYRTPLGVSHVISLYNGGEDERFAWAILLEREKVLDLQDFFVKPALRRKGHAASLVSQIRKLRRERIAPHLPLVSSVHQVDADRFSVPIAKIARRLGLELRESLRPCYRYQAFPSGVDVE